MSREWKRTSVSLCGNLLRVLDAECKRTGNGRSFVIERALRSYFGHGELLRVYGEWCYMRGEFGNE